MIAKQVPDGAMRSAAMTRIEQNLDSDPKKAPKGEAEMAKVWKDQASSSPATETYEKYLAAIWRETGCAAEGAPYVLRGLLRNLEAPHSFYGPESQYFNKQSPSLRALASAFLEQGHCIGARGLDDADQARLNANFVHVPPASMQQ